MKKIVIFGIGKNAEMAKFYFENDKKYINKVKVVAFTVDKQYLKKNKFMGLPIIEAEKLEDNYPPEKYFLFVTIGYTKMNEIREKKYLEYKNKGYKFVNYISSNSIIHTNIIGENNFIMDNAVIEPFVEIGNNNAIRGGGTIGHNTKIGDNCFISTAVSIGGENIIENNCFIGINSTTRDKIRIKYKTLIGGGTWISESTEEYGVYLAGKAYKLDKKSIDIKI